MRSGRHKSFVPLLHTKCVNFFVMFLPVSMHPYCRLPLNPQPQYHCYSVLQICCCHTPSLSPPPLPRWCCQNHHYYYCCPLPAPLASTLSLLFTITTALVPSIPASTSLASKRGYHKHNNNNNNNNNNTHTYSHLLYVIGSVLNKNYTHELSLK